MLRKARPTCNPYNAPGHKRILSVAVGKTAVAERRIPSVLASAVALKAIDWIEPFKSEVFMRRWTTFVGILFAVSFCPVPGTAQTAPKPGAEHKKLEVWVGTWSTQGEVKSGNGYGVPAGKFSRTDQFRWLPGGFFLQHTRDGKGPENEIHHMSMVGYSPTLGKYTWTWFDLASPASASFTMTSSGDRWVTTGGGTSRAGKAFQERCTNDFLATGSITFTCATSPDGKTWTASLEGKATKVK